MTPEFLVNGAYEAWVDATDPERALTTWDTVRLEAHSTAGRHGEVQRGPRAARINALRQRIEREFLPTPDGTVRVRLTLQYKTYSETYGFLHKSSFTYRIERIPS